MSIELENLRKVGLYEEPAGSYNVDHSGTPADYIDVPYKEGGLTHQPNRVKHNPMTGALRIDAHDEDLLGYKKGVVSLAMTLHSHGLDLDGDEAPPTTANWALLRALKAVMGGTFATTDESAQTVVVADGTTTTTVEVTSGHGDRFQAGGVILCECISGSAVLEAREIKSVSGDIVTVREAFSAAPVTGQPVRGGVTVHLTEDPATSLQLMIQGREDSDGMLYRGLQLTSLGIELAPGELGTITIGLEGGSWDDLGAGSTVAPTITHYEPILCDPLQVRVPTFDDTTLVNPCASAVAISPAIAFVDQRCGKAEDGVARKRRNRVHPVATGTFTVPREDSTWRDAYADREVRALCIQCGALAGGTVLFAFPRIQITDVKPVAGPNGIASEEVTWAARLDTLGTTEALYSAMRIHFG